MGMSFWPHIWAVPLTFIAGLFVGWLLRAQLDRGGPGRRAGHRSDAATEYARED